MERRYIEKLDLPVYTETLDNGLEIYLCPMPFNEITAQMTVRFGGSVLEFENEGKIVKVPAGVAHFLEHKMFEKPGLSPLQIYENNGASANAFTSYDMTAYYFEGPTHFLDNLQTLLDCVHKPYFTKENIQKEKGIISQEKKASMDEIPEIIFEKAAADIFKNSYYKNSVLGSLDDINNMTKEEIEVCYKTFYHPSNMFLTITGGIDVDETIKFIKDYYKNFNISKKEKPVTIGKEEPEEVVKVNDVIYKDTTNKEILISYKIKNPNFFKNEKLNDIYIGLFADMNFSEITDFPDITFNDNNILSDVSSYYYKAGDYYIINAEVTVKEDENKIIDLIDKQIKSKEFSERNFNLIKKVLLNYLVISSERVVGVKGRIVNDIFKYGKIDYNPHETYQNLDFETFKKFANKLNLENRNITIVKSK